MRVQENAMEAIRHQIPVMNIENIALGKSRPVRMPLFGTTNYFPEVGIRTQDAVVAFEEFNAGDTVRFSPNRTIVAIVQQGTARITYTLPGTHHTEVKEMTVEKGDVYVIPSGAYLEWKIPRDGAYRHLVILVPGYSPQVADKT